VYVREHKPGPFSAVVIAGSLGGLRALRAIIPVLPNPFPVPTMISQHGGGTELAHILSWESKVGVGVARAGQPLGTSGITVVPAGIALTAADQPGDPIGFASVGHQRRPADELLAAGAREFGTGLIAVVLTGRLDDGAQGVRVVKRAGGRVIVQDPAGALASGMPTAAMATGCVDFVLPLRCIAAVLVALTMAPGGAELLRVPVASWAAYA
jgi:two-component system chemotaxis response regulator CheB